MSSEINESGRKAGLGKTRFFKKKISVWRFAPSFLMMIYDAAAISIAYFFALLVRFDFRYDKIPLYYFQPYWDFLPYYICFCLMLFWLLRMYHSVWRFASFTELFRIILATLISSVFHVFCIRLFFPDNVPFSRMPISYHVIGTMAQFFLITVVRFVYRFLLLFQSHYFPSRQGIGVFGGALPTRSGGQGVNLYNEQSSISDYIPRIMMIGAGDAGQMLLRDIRMSSYLKGRVVCIIDDNPAKWGRYLEGVSIIGGRDEILAGVEKYRIDKIYLAIPSASVQQRRDILNICKETNCELKNLPGMYQLVKGDVKVSHMRDVSIEDLLGRDPIRTDLEEVFEFITGKIVLVTGGGGSIGSELCRQIAAHKPKTLIIFDIYENNAYDIQLELREKYPELDLHTLIGSVRDSRKIFQVFDEYRPQVVYHAAAHKHVPLMEDSPCEAIKNNSIGTYKTAYAAMVHGCDRFVLISTDKAVNPTNIMGASKRLCEMIIQSFDAKIKAGRAQDIPQLFTHNMAAVGYPPLSDKTAKNVHTDFVAVRFGNVLGSNGSVIPIFKKQIEKGGPVTVTDPEIIRYFMTIPEAVSLVLLAGTYAKGGEIFVLDMGSPIKIDTLARNLIRMSGFKPDVDIKIEYTGLRPGEKLYEEKLMAEEGLKKTENDLIHIGCPIPFDTDCFLTELKCLMKSAYENREDIFDVVAQIVSTYHREK